MERARRAAASGLTVGSILLFAAAFVEGAWADWVFVLVTPAIPVLLIVLAVCRGRPRPLLMVGILALGTLMMLSAAGIRLLESRPEAPWFLGLPASVLILGFGLVAAPLVLVGWVYAVTFDDTSTSIAEIRRRAVAAGDREG